MQTLRTKLALATALVACVLALAGCTDDTVVADCAPVVATPAATSAAIAATLDRIKAKYQLNAIILSAEQNGQPLYRTALGLSTSGVPASTDMHFRVGGVGWQLLSTVLLRMIEQDPARLALTESSVDVVSGLSPRRPGNGAHAGRVERGLW